MNYRRPTCNYEQFGSNQLENVSVKFLGGNEYGLIGAKFGKFFMNLVGDVESNLVVFRWSGIRPSESRQEFCYER